MYLVAKQRKEIAGNFKGLIKTILFNRKGIIKAVIPADQKQPSKDQNKIRFGIFLYELKFIN